MSPITQIPLTANGNVSPARFIAPVQGTTGQYGVQASDPTVPILGVSYNETRFPPNGPADDGYCSIAGEPLPYHGPGTICGLICGDTETNAMQPLTTDSNGKGVAVSTSATTLIWVGAFSLQAGVLNDEIMVMVLSPFYQLKGT